MKDESRLKAVRCKTCQYTVYTRAAWDVQTCGCGAVVLAGNPFDPEVFRFSSSLDGFQLVEVEVGPADIASFQLSFDRHPTQNIVNNSNVSAFVHELVEELRSRSPVQKKRELEPVYPFEEI